MIKYIKEQDFYTEVKVDKINKSFLFTFLFKKVISPEPFLEVLCDEISSNNLTGLTRFCFDDLSIVCYTRKLSQLQICVKSDVAIFNTGLIPTFKLNVLGKSSSLIDRQLQELFSEKIRKVDFKNIKIVKVYIWFKEQ